MRKLLFTLALLASVTSPARATDFAHAIARAEGFYVRHSKGQRNHNPGNVQRHDVYAHFKNDAEGWAALYAQLAKVKDGASTRYTVNMTLAEFGRVYSNGNRNWARNVAAVLKVDTNARIWEILECAPRITVPTNLKDCPVVILPSMPALSVNDATSADTFTSSE